MSMSHKAFLFDDTAFDRELRGILGEALRTGDCAALKSFVVQQLSALKDPYEAGRSMPTGSRE
jgi:hypothetical protein